MDEIWIRVLLVSIVVGVAGGLGLLQRGRGYRPTQLASSSFEPGIYLFASNSCSTCPAARSTMIEAIGAKAFSEVVWERDPAQFELAGVDSVPTVMIVDGNGGVRLQPGHPDPTAWQL